MADMTKQREAKKLEAAKKLCGIQAIEMEPEPDDDDCEFCDDDFLMMMVSMDDADVGDPEEETMVFVPFDELEEEPSYQLRLTEEFEETLSSVSSGEWGHSTSGATRSGARMSSASCWRWRACLPPS